jgi:hypothetical protein
LGAVAVDIHKQEREFEHLTLSDENVVEYLIKYRNKIDVAYGANTNIDINSAGDMFEFNQELVCLYASLDDVIKQCNFKEKQLKLLELTFDGNTIKDVCKMNIGYGRSATYSLLERMIKKIVDTNNKNWKETMDRNGYVVK